jgi:hypothetical protein
MLPVDVKDRYVLLLTPTIGQYFVFVVLIHSDGRHGHEGDRGSHG